MSFLKLKSLAAAIVAMSLVLMACSKDVDSETVAYQFVRLYFVEDNIAEAVKLTSDSARMKLEEVQQEIETMGAKEPAGDKPLVKAELLEAQPVSEDAFLYIYRVTTDIEDEGMEPVTAKIWISKDGNAWRVSKFVQDE